MYLILPRELDRNCNVMRSHEMGGNSISCRIVTPFEILLGLIFKLPALMFLFIYIQREVPRVYLFSMQLVIQNIYMYLFLCTSTCILTWFFRIWELPALSFPGTSKTIRTKFSHFLVWSCQPAIAYCLPANRSWPLSSDTRITISKWRLYVHQPALLPRSCHALLKLPSLNHGWWWPE